MKITRLAAIGLSLMIGAADLAAQAPAERSNPALDLLRAGVWMERGDNERFAPAGGKIEEPTAVLVNAGWEMPQLTPPNLTPPRLVPPLDMGVQNRAPAVVEVVPVAAARAVNAAPVNATTPCEDLAEKARKLRIAASRCDSDLAGGASFCYVEPDYSSPSMPRQLSAGDARRFAGVFEGVVSRGSDQTCAEYGGEGTMLLAIERPLMYEHERGAPAHSLTGKRKQCMDAYLRDNYNDYVADTLVPYFSAGSMGTRTYWKSVFETAVVKGSILRALGAGGSYYSTREYEALGRSLNEWGWLGVIGRRNTIIGSASRAANFAAAQTFLKAVIGVVVTAGGSFATTAHALAYSACASEAP